MCSSRYVLTALTFCLFFQVDNSACLFSLYSEGSTSLHFSSILLSSQSQIHVFKLSAFVQPSPHVRHEPQPEIARFDTRRFTHQDRLLLLSHASRESGPPMTFRYAKVHHLHSSRIQISSFSLLYPSPWIADSWSSMVVLLCTGGLRPQPLEEPED